MTRTHSYRSHLSWSGSTGPGYDSYGRTHRLLLPPAEGELVVSSDPAFQVVIEPTVEHADEQATVVGSAGPHA